MEVIGKVVEAVRSAESTRSVRAAQAASLRKASTGAILASDADRDRAVQRLEDAFSEGRLTSAELDERTGRALAARTLGELDGVLEGLPGLTEPIARHPVRVVLFWIATVLLSPFVLASGLFVVFGADLGDHVAGLIFLAITAAPLLSLWRWSRPGRL